MVKNQGTKQRGQRTLGDCWQWKANGQSSKGDNCSFRHDINKRANSIPLERNLYGHPLAGLLWERQFEKILLKHGWEKIPNWECLFVHRGKGPSPPEYVDDIRLAGKKQNLDPMWKVLNKEVDLGEPTSFLDHIYLGCTQRQCEISKDIVDNYRTMFESRISAGGTEKLPCSENLCISSWSYDMEGHAKKCVQRYRELANRTTQQLYKVSTPCIDDHHFKEEELKSLGELSKVCSQIVLKCLYLVRIGRPDILWSVNKLARSITKWTKACDKKLSRMISYIHHACDYKHIVMWETLQNNADWDCFKTPILKEILRIQNLLRVEHCAFLEAIRLFQSVGCVRNKLQFRTVQQNQKSFLWTQDCGWTVSPHLIYGIWSWQFWETRIRVNKHGETCVRTKVRFVQYLTQFKNECNLREWSIIWIMLISLKRPIFSSGSFVVCVWRQRSSDQDDHKGKKSHNETCFQDPQRCALLVVR